MAALPRSEVSFRRQGSSGLVWDDKLLSGELKKISTKDNEGGETKDAKPSSVPRSRSNGGGRGFRSAEIKPSYDPPSPKMSGCGICGGMFGKPVESSPKQQPRKAAGHRPHRR